MKRTIFDIILFIFLFISPWWVIVPIAFVGMFIFKNFYEFIVSILIIYSLYYVPKNGIINSEIFFFAIVILIFIIVQYLKNNIILYKK